MKRALVVDDNPEDRIIIKKELSEIVKQIDVCENIDEAKELIKVNHYDLVLLDIFLTKDRADTRLDELYAIDDSLNIILLSGAEADFDVKRNGHHPTFLNKNRLNILANLIQCKHMVKEIKAVVNEHR